MIMDIQALRRFLGLQAGTVGLLLMVVLMGLGERMAERFLPIYLMALGGGAWSVGLLGAMDNLLSAIYALVGGHLADRYGLKRSLLWINLVAMAGYALAIWAPTWEVVLAGAVFYLSWSSLSMPASMGLIAKLLPTSKRTMGVTMHSLVKRFPMALGPIIGGSCIAFLGERDGVRLAFAVAMVLALIAIPIQQRWIPDDEQGKKQEEESPWQLLALLSGDLRRLLVSDVLVRFCEQIPYAFVVIWCMKSIAEPVSAVQFGVLTTIEMATAVLIYIPVAWLADKGEKKPFVVTTFIFFTIFPLILLYSQSFAWLVVAFIIRGLKEFGEPTRKALILDLAPEGRKAAVFGVYYLVRDTVVAVAAFAGAWLWQMGPEVNLLTAFAFGIVGTLVFAVWGKEVKPTV
ncbi:MAG: MFS transporter [Magnetococcales bacterium]|nr:MFS transporter [Magnetococcales bacterium]NGZ26651.1 MFS transporter [Magnetococcales bacterium]